MPLECSNKILLTGAGLTLSALRVTLALSDHADFCVAQCKLRGWKALASRIERLCRG